MDDERFQYFFHGKYWTIWGGSRKYKGHIYLLRKLKRGLIVILYPYSGLILKYRYLDFSRFIRTFAANPSFDNFGNESDLLNTQIIFNYKFEQKICNYSQLSAK